MNLYAGKMLIVNLTEQEISIEPLRQEWLRDYRGCWGLALRYYWEHVTPSVEPLSLENVIVIMTGPFGGTLIPMSGRFCLVSKSPHTGTVFESNAGGAFGPELKLAGYDGIIIKGKAESLCHLQIMNDKVTIENGEALTGKGIFETERLLKESIGSPEAKTLAIGPAGENCGTYACVGTESYRQLGRGGTGALFGSKNLKGVVCRGTGGVSVADLPIFLKKVKQYKEKNLLTDDNLWAKTDGTPVLVDVTNEMGIHPTRNFTDGVNDNKHNLNSDAIQAAKLSDRACTSCPMACGKFTHINGAEVEGPEYETLCLAGSNCEVNNLEQVIRFNRLCDDLGLDTISCGNTIGLAMELTEKGDQDFNLTFGNTEAYINVVSEIAHRSTDRGKDLASGAKKLAQKYGQTDLSTEIKGMELPAYDPRGHYGMGLAYATSERGACHLRAFPLFAEDPFDTEALTLEVIDRQNLSAIKWSMGLCDFWGTITPEIMADLLTSGSGQKVKAEELISAGERIWNLSRLFNVEAGFSSVDDTLPPKIINQPLKKGPHAGRIFKQDDFESAKRLYYQLRGWDENGVPTQKKLAELGLEQLFCN